MTEKIFLYLEDGTKLSAKSFGHFPEDHYLSELVFNTSMQGYQEIISDPSYCDQSIVMTYPLIGNYGINFEDNESITPHLKTLILKEYCDTPSNWRSETSLDQYLAENKIVGIHSIDTRMLTKLIRSKGAMKVLISGKELSQDTISHGLGQCLAQDQIKRVSVKQITHHPVSGGKRIALIDFGFKKNILASLTKRGCDVIVFPFNTSFEKIKSFHPDGIVLSNGPGDPESIKDVIPTVQKLQESYPMLCICMGHEIFAMANGAKIEKMKFGHRGANHPVKDFENNRVYITAQNHGYCVERKSIDHTELIITQENLNDKTIEGLKHKTYPSISVQYHPEASPGPHDTKFLFNNFIQMMENTTHA